MRDPAEESLPIAPPAVPGPPPPGQSHLQFLLEKQPSCLLRVARSGMVLACNEAGLGLFGKTELVDVLESSVTDHVAVDAGAWRDFADRVWAKGAGSMECALTGAVDEPRTIQLQAIALHDHADGMESVLVAARDTTPIRRLERTLKSEGTPRDQAREAEAKIQAAIAGQDQLKALVDELRAEHQRAMSALQQRDADHARFAEERASIEATLREQHAVAEQRAAEAERRAQTSVEEHLRLTSQLDEAVREQQRLGEALRQRDADVEGARGDRAALEASVVEERRALAALQEEHRTLQIAFEEQRRAFDARLAEQRTRAEAHLASGDSRLQAAIEDANARVNAATAEADARVQAAIAQADARVQAATAEADARVQAALADADARARAAAGDTDAQLLAAGAEADARLQAATADADARLRALTADADARLLAAMADAEARVQAATADADARLQAAAAETEARLRDARAEHDRLTTLLDEAGREQQRLAEELRIRDAAVAQTVDTLDAKLRHEHAAGRQRIAELENRIQAAVAEQGRLTVLVEQSRAEQEQLTAAIAERDARIAGIQSAHSEAQAQIAALEAKLHEAAADHQQLLTLVEHERTERQQLSDALRDREREAGKAQADYAAAQTRMAALEGQLLTAGAEHHQLMALVEHQRAEQQQLAAALQSLDADAVRIREERAAGDVRIAALEAQLHTAVGEQQKLTAQIEEGRLRQLELAAMVRQRDADRERMRQEQIAERVRLQQQVTERQREFAHTERALRDQISLLEDQIEGAAAECQRMSQAVEQTIMAGRHAEAFAQQEVALAVRRYEEATVELRTLAEEHRATCAEGQRLTKEIERLTKDASMAAAERARLTEEHDAALAELERRLVEQFARATANRDRERAEIIANLQADLVLANANQKRLERLVARAEAAMRAMQTGPSGGGRRTLRLASDRADLGAAEAH